MYKFNKLVLKVKAEWKLLFLRSLWFIISRVIDFFTFKVEYRLYKMRISYFWFVPDDASTLSRLISYSFTDILSIFRSRFAHKYEPITLLPI